MSEAGKHNAKVMEMLEGQRVQRLEFLEDKIHLVYTDGTHWNLAVDPATMNGLTLEWLVFKNGSAANLDNGRYFLKGIPHPESKQVEIPSTIKEKNDDKSN